MTHVKHHVITSAVLAQRRLGHTYIYLLSQANSHQKSKATANQAERYDIDRSSVARVSRIRCTWVHCEHGN